MRFIDWNGNGNLDARDVATSIGVDQADENDDDAKGEANTSREPQVNSGCATMAALVLLPILLLLSAL